MSFDFDASVAGLDALQDEYFGESFTIEGIADPVTGIFDEGFQEFQEADIDYTTVEIIAQSVSGINLVGKNITRVNTGDTFLINKMIPSDTKLLLVLT